MNPRDFLILAQALAGQTTEAAWRSAISRAYYAAFHVARTLLASLRFVVPRADRAHAYLWLRLHNCGDPQVSQAGADLNALRGDRNEADYDLQSAIAPAFAQAQVQVAQQVVQTLDAVAADPARRAAITAEMARYERNVLHDVTWQP
jgi:uncharacterized protein (UPF0332 family)